MRLRSSILTTLLLLTPVTLHAEDVPKPEPDPLAASKQTGQVPFTCYDGVLLSDKLKEYEETVIMYGKISNGKVPTGAIAMITSRPDGKSWTFLVMPNPKQLCIVSAGIDTELSLDLFDILPKGISHQTR